jgi:hypothetical protein
MKLVTAETLAAALNAADIDAIRYDRDPNGETCYVPGEVAPLILAAIPPDPRLDALLDCIGFVADWAHNCSPSDDPHPKQVSPYRYGFDDIEQRCRDALAAFEEKA